MKLDELIRAGKEARNSMVDLEDVSDEELAKLQRQFQQLREQQGGVIEAAKNILDKQE